MSGDFKFIPLTALLFTVIALAVFAPSRPTSAISGIPAVAANTASATEHQSRNIERRSPIKTAAVVTWKGNHDHRWSNAANWESGHVPGASDVARFAAPSSSGVLVDADSPGAVAGLILEPDYRGTLSLKRDMTVSNDLVLAGGTLNQGNYRLSVSHYRQTGGTFTGGDASLMIQDEATVSGGTLLTSKSMTAQSLTINSPAVVTMAANSKLDLTGDGEPLRGSGLLDVTTNGPNSLEYTGPSTADVTAAAPIKGALGFGDPPRPKITSQPQSFQPQESSLSEASAFSRSGALTLTAREEDPWSAVIDTVNGFAYFGTMTGPGIVVKVRLSDFTRVGALVLNSGENELRCAAIDTANGFAYFGGLSGALVKVRLSDLTRVDGFNAGGPLAAAVIDTASGFA